MNSDVLLTVGALLLFFMCMGIGSAWHYFKYERKEKNSPPPSGGGRADPL
jgi:hypothetical protein